MNLEIRSYRLLARIPLEFHMQGLSWLIDCRFHHDYYVCEVAYPVRMTIAIGSSLTETMERLAGGIPVISGTALAYIFRHLAAVGLAEEIGEDQIELGRSATKSSSQTYLS